MPKHTEIVQCSSCGIAIGPGHIEETPHRRGGKILCSICFNKSSKAKKVGLYSRKGGYPTHQVLIK